MRLFPVAIPVALALLAGCGGPPTDSWNGTVMADFFPSDGSRDAEYVNDDSTNVTWHMLTHEVQPVETASDTRVTYTLEYSKDDGTLLYAVKWSVRSNQPVRIEAYAEGTADFTVYDPPIDVVNADMVSGDAVTTTTGGTTFTGTYVGPEDCPVLWGGLSWTGCAHITIDDGDGDNTKGPLFAGDYWLVARYGEAWLQTTGFTQPWKLSDYNWDTGGGS